MAGGISPSKEVIYENFNAITQVSGFPCGGTAADDFDRRGADRPTFVVTDLTPSGFSASGNSVVIGASAGWVGGFPAGQAQPASHAYLWPDAGIPWICIRLSWTLPTPR